APTARCSAGAGCPRRTCSPAGTSTTRCASGPRSRRWPRRPPRSCTWPRSGPPPSCAAPLSNGLSPDSGLAALRGQPAGVAAAEVHLAAVGPELARLEAGVGQRVLHLVALV